MADAQIYKGGTPVTVYGQGAGDPILYRPPYGKYPFDSSPPFDAHFNGAAGSVDYPGGCPFKPSELEWQRDNVRHARLDAGDTLQMIVIPVNHWIHVVRFDVNAADPRMAGAAVDLVAQRVRVDPAAPYDPARFTVADDPAFAAAVAAQVAAPIPLDTPGSAVVWLWSLTAAASLAVTGTADLATGAVAGTASGSASGYAVPLYVEPEFVPDPVTGEIARHQTGALILGIRVASMPTDASVRIEDALNDFYLTTRLTGLQSPSFT
jgi:hypothetical protein